MDAAIVCATNLVAKLQDRCSCTKRDVTQCKVFVQLATIWVSATVTHAHTGFNTKNCETCCNSCCNRCENWNPIQLYETIVAAGFTTILTVERGVTRNNDSLSMQRRCETFCAKKLKRLFSNWCIKIIVLVQNLGWYGSEREFEPEIVIYFFLNLGKFMLRYSRKIWCYNGTEKHETDWYLNGWRTLLLWRQWSAQSKC